MPASSKLSVGAAWALAALLTGSAATAAAPNADRACFYARNISGWTAAGRSAVNLRVGVSDFYQLSLLAPCDNLDWAQHIGLEHRGTSWICTGLDATLIVPQQGERPPMRCAVNSVRKLSPEEVKALPRGQKP